MTTVYAINQRVFDQSSANGSNNKSSSTTADQFLAALNQAGTQVSGGVNAAPSAEQALKKVFDRQVDETKQAEKPAEKPKRAESKAPERQQQADDGREAETVAEPEAKAKPQDDTTTSQDDAGEQNTAAPKAEEKVVKQDSETVQVVQEATTPKIEAVATVVPVEQQVAQTTVEAGEAKVAEVVAATDPENIAEDAKGAQTKGGDVLQADAGDDAGEVVNFDATATQQAAKAKNAQHADRNAAAQAQADDLAANLDDTGANLNVQVKVSEAPRPLQATVSAEAVVAQDVDGVDMPLTTQTNAAQPTSQGQANAAQSGQAGAAAQDPSLLNKPLDVKPLVAALAAAQAENASQPQAASSGSGNQNQAVAGLNGASGTQAAAKTAQAQAAQAPRPQHMPQAKEIMDQVKVQIAKAGANGDTIKVQLKPVELGSIEVKLDVAKDGSVSGVVTADNKDTLAMLKNDSRTLEKALSDAGFKTDAGSLTFNLRGEGQQQSAQDQGATRSRRRSALSAANGIDATGANMAAQAQARLGGGRAGVDIQV